MLRIGRDSAAALNCQTKELKEEDLLIFWPRAHEMIFQNGFNIATTKRVLWKAINCSLFRFATQHQPWYYSNVCNYIQYYYYNIYFVPSPTYNFTFMERNEDGINS